MSGFQDDPLAGLRRGAREFTDTAAEAFEHVGARASVAAAAAGDALATRAREAELDRRWESARVTLNETGSRVADSAQDTVSSLRTTMGSGSASPSAIVAPGGAAGMTFDVASSASRTGAMIHGHLVPHLVEHRGSLSLRVEGSDAWHPQWCVLSGSELFFYAEAGARDASRVVALADTQRISQFHLPLNLEGSMASPTPHTLQIVQGDGELLVLAAPTSVDEALWLEALQRVAQAERRWRATREASQTVARSVQAGANDLWKGFGWAGGLAAAAAKAAMAPVPGAQPPRPSVFGNAFAGHGAAAAAPPPRPSPFGPPL